MPVTAEYPTDGDGKSSGRTGDKKSRPTAITSSMQIERGDQGESNGHYIIFNICWTVVYMLLSHFYYRCRAYLVISFPTGVRSLQLLNLLNPLPTYCIGSSRESSWSAGSKQSQSRLVNYTWSQSDIFPPKLISRSTPFKRG